MDLGLAKRTALVSGSYRGTGAAIARVLAEEGATVVVHGLEPGQAEPVAREIHALGGTAHCATGDLRTEAGARDAARQALEAVGHVDVLVNNYGTAAGGGWLDDADDDWLAMFQTNVMSGARLVRHLVPGMKERGFGRVIFVGTVGSVRPRARIPGYYASKASLPNMTVSLAKELAGTGITVNNVSPGMLATAEVKEGLLRRAAKHGLGGDWAEVERHAAREWMPNPTGRLGRIEEVGALVAFLASDHAGYVNGARPARRRRRRGLRVAQRVAAVAALAAWLAPAALAQATDASDSGWLEIRTPNFWLVSDAPEPVTIDVLSRLERFRSAARILTGAERLDPALPTRIYVFGSSEAYARFAPRTDSAGFFVTDLEANRLAVDASTLGEPGALDVALHEYVHFLVRNQRSPIQYPTWYEEGFADAISTVRFEPGHGLVVGAVPPSRAAWLARGDWLPLETIVSARGYDDLSAEQRAMFYAQSWLFVHRLTWGHVGGRTQRDDQMERYLRRVGTGEPPLPVFRDVFGTDPAGMQKELRAYAKAGPPLVLVKDELPALESSHAGARSLPRTESQLLLAELQLARGEAGAGEAEALAASVLRTELTHARARVVRALARVEQGRPYDGDDVRAAVEAEPDHPLVVRGAARLELRRLEKGLVEESAARVAASRAEELFRHAVTLDPYVPAAHAGLGYAALALGEAQEAYDALLEAYRLAPWDLNVALVLGELHATSGDEVGARRLLRRVAVSAHQPEMRARARTVLDRIDAAKASAGSGP